MITFNRFSIICVTIVFCFFFITGCAGRDTHVNKLTTRDVPIAVLCKPVVVRPRLLADTAVAGLELEQQGAVNRSTIAGQKVYVKRLEGAVIGCGGTIQDENDVR